MIIKPIIYPRKLEQLEALERRVHPNHLMKNVIKQDLIKYKTGYKGELAVNYPLRFLSEEKFLILHDLRLKDSISYFQIDTLIICSKFCLILEVKNYYGTLLFDEDFNQMTRIVDNKEEGFKNPILQVNRQKIQLNNWLRINNFQHIPIKKLVVISSPKTIIKSTSPSKLISSTVVHSDALPQKITDMELGCEKNFLDIDKMNELAQQMLNAHTIENVDLKHKYQVERKDILKGVQCSKCKRIPMIRQKRKWYCQSCHLFTENAHEKALKDYAYLIDKQISNEEARDFLQVNSPKVVRKILSSDKYTSFGKTYAKRYVLL